MKVPFSGSLVVGIAERIDIPTGIYTIAYITCNGVSNTNSRYLTPPTKYS